MPKRGRSTEKWTEVDASVVASRTTNPIRKIVDQLKPGKSELPIIALSIGDPTIDGNLLPPAGLIKQVQDNVASHKFDGYPPSVGYQSAREAVAEYHKKNFAADVATTFQAKDVILASGASHALEMAIATLCDEGSNILLPEPCFSLYTTIAENRGILPKFYRCDSQKNWEADLKHLEEIANDRTKAILITNPSNPCGSNFSKQHVTDILAVAEKLKIPVIADEIYAGMVFGGEVFTSVANIKTDVPRIIVGGIAKNYVVPGWRMGWAIMEDPAGVMGKVFAGMVAMSTLIVGPNSLIQSCLHNVLLETPASYGEELRGILAKNAQLCYDELKDVKGLQTSQPQAAMYMMVGIDFKVYKAFKDDVEFSKVLLEEQNVVVLPGQVFRAQGFVRIVTAKGTESLKTAMARIKEFCAKHAQ